MGRTELPQKNKMPHKFTFVWDDNKIENQGEEFHFLNHFENLSQVIYCGTFSEPVSLNGVEVQTIHFTDFKMQNGLFNFFMGPNERIFRLPANEHLFFKLITPSKYL
jgi:hypothetical protein